MQIKNRRQFITILAFVTLLITGCNGEPTPGKNESKVTFDSNGGTAVAAQIVTNGDKITVPDVAKQNVIFDGWYQDDVKWDFTNDAVTRNITLTAAWREPSIIIDFYMTLGTLPTLYAGLNIFNNDHETYFWYLRGGTFDRTYFPERVHFFETQRDGATSHIDHTLILEQLFRLRMEHEDPYFNFYFDDLRAHYILDFPIAANIPYANYGITMLSDGTGSYSTYKAIKENEYVAFQADWDSYVNSYQNEGMLFNWGSDNNGMPLAKYAPFLTKYANVNYWLQFPEYLSNTQSDTLKKDKDNFKITKKNPHTMYEALDLDDLSLFNDAVLSAAETNIAYYNEQFINRDRDILIITGTNLRGLETNVDYIDQVISDYGDTHYMYFKPHPAYPPDGELNSYFDDNDIITLPHRTPMEAILWMYPDVYIGGYNSSLYMSSEPGQTLFFFGEITDPLTDLEELGHFDNVTYYSLDE